MQVVKELTKLTLNAFRKCDELQSNVKKAFIKEPGDKRIDRNPYNQLVAQKATNILWNLQQKQCQLIFIMRKQVSNMWEKNTWKEHLIRIELLFSLILSNLRLAYDLNLSNFKINALLQAAINQDNFVEDAFVMVAAHNKCTELTKKFNFGGVAQICSIFYTTIFLPPARINVKDILQVSIFPIEKKINK